MLLLEHIPGALLCQFVENKSGDILFNNKRFSALTRQATRYAVRHGIPYSKHKSWSTDTAPFGTLLGFEIARYVEEKQR